MRPKKILLMILFAILCLPLASCRGVSPVDPETRLRERVEGYIFARQNLDLLKLQSYMVNPGEARIGNIRYKKSKIMALSIAEDGLKAEVKLENEMLVMGFTFRDTPQTLNWSWHKKDWYVESSNNKSNPFTTGSGKKSLKDVNQLKQ